MLQSNRIRFEHTFLEGIGRYVVTSPDVTGFHITGATLAEAERDALAMLSLLRDKGLLPHPGSLMAVEFDVA
ncbi:MAG TPA: hypothetical protein VH414_15440 [Lichenihabitans sp.]|jgi:predicted RNase H-like HicB family nuclease|nr:hypothetical protein [Lichenihabitans sp.]